MDVKTRILAGLAVPVAKILWFIVIIRLRKLRNRGVILPFPLVTVKLTGRLYVEMLKARLRGEL